MAFPVPKAHDLVLDARTVPGPHPLDAAGVQGGTVQAPPDDSVGLRCGVGDVARELGSWKCLRIGGKGPGVPIPILPLQPIPRDGPAVEPGWSAGLEAPHREPEGPQVRRQKLGRRLPGAPGRIALEPHMGEAVEEGPRAQDHRRRPIPRPGSGPDPRELPALQPQPHHLGLVHLNPRVPLHHPLHVPCVPGPVRLGPARPHRRPLAGVQPPKLNPGGVDGAPHLPPQGVDLPDQVPLAEPPDGGVAGHLAHRVQVHGEEQGPSPQARRG